MNLSRRHFLRTATAASLGFAGLQQLFDASAHGQAPSASEGGFGPLSPDPEGILDLPAGFAYRKISPMGETMSDGLLVPGMHDGMAAFPGGPGGKTILVRNHEITASPGRGLSAPRTNCSARSIRARSGTTDTARHPAWVALPP